MSDAAQANLSKYKSGFSTQKPSTCKTTPFKFVTGVAPDQAKAMGITQTSHPKPINPHKK
jgi:hypothetical protein